MACYAEGKQWSFWQESHVKTKFWGKSMELIPKGLVHVLLNGRGEHYTFSKGNEKNEKIKLSLITSHYVYEECIFK